MKIMDVGTVIGLAILLVAGVLGLLCSGYGAYLCVSAPHRVREKASRYIPTAHDWSGETIRQKILPLNLLLMILSTSVVSGVLYVIDRAVIPLVSKIADIETVIHFGIFLITGVLGLLCSGCGAYLCIFAPHRVREKVGRHIPTAHDWSEETIRKKILPFDLALMMFSLGTFSTVLYAIDGTMTPRVSCITMLGVVIGFVGIFVALS